MYRLFLKALVSCPSILDEVTQAVVSAVRHMMSELGLRVDSTVA